VAWNRSKQHGGVAWDFGLVGYYCDDVYECGGMAGQAKKIKNLKLIQPKNNIVCYYIRNETSNRAKTLRDGECEPFWAS
jgi:hypothetical protein